MKSVKLFFKSYWKPLLLILIFYVFTLLAILRANDYYVDDTGRAVIGYGWTSDFKRYSSTFLSFFLLNLNTKAADLSPFTQIFALALVALSSVILCLLLTGKKNGEKLPALPLALSAFLGIAPYSISLWVYKFDAPCMALALFVSILPFLFKDAKKKFIFPLVSIFCLVVMWTSYQAFSGVYPLLCVLIVLLELLRGEKLKSLSRFLIVSVISYLLAGLVYKILPDFSVAPSYRATEIFALSELIPGFFKNLALVFSTIWSDFTLIWKVALFLSALVFLLSFVLRKGNRLKSLGFGCLILISLAVISFGPFLVLREIALTPRSLCASSVAFACLGIILGDNLNKKLRLLSAPTFLLLYSFMIFAFALGNAFADQKAYHTFRNSALASDLAALYPDSAVLAQKKVQILGGIGLSAVSEHVAEQYPLTPRILDEGQTGLSEHVWGTRRLLFYYGLTFDNFFVADNGRFDCNSFSLKLETAYHKILESSDESSVCIVVK